MLIVHANWTDGTLRLWAESVAAFTRRQVEGSAAPETVARSGSTAGPAVMTAPSLQHPFAALARELREALLAPDAWPGAMDGVADGTLRMRLPGDPAGPWPSDRLASCVGAEDGLADATLCEVEVPCLVLEPVDALPALLRMESTPPQDRIEVSPSVRYWVAVARFVAELLADQRFIPTIVRDAARDLRGRWIAWLHDEPSIAAVGALVTAMPASVRAVVDGADHEPWPMLDEAINRMTDAAVRAVLRREDFVEALDGHDPTDPHVAWLAGLLGEGNAIEPPTGVGPNLLRDVGHWVARLDETAGQTRHLMLQLSEPALPVADDPSEARWRLTFHLVADDDRTSAISAEAIWEPRAGASSSRSADGPLEDVLLTELSRAARIYRPLERTLSERAPRQIELTTKETFEFLREHRPVLEEAGFVVDVPPWWDQQRNRLGLRLHIEPSAPSPMQRHGASLTRTTLGMSTVVRYRWQAAVGDEVLSDADFARLTEQTAPLVYLRGRWIELHPDDLRSARRYTGDAAAGEMTLQEAFRTSYGGGAHATGLPVLGLESSGWLADVLHAATDQQRIPEFDQPAAFEGSLRPYQVTGLRWLSFLDEFGFGACLADDMGLGKTIQLIALLLHERQETPASDGGVGPTLLVVPTSLMGNWDRELARFAPTLRVHLHHGPDRDHGAALEETARRHDIVITTYGLVGRDFESLAAMEWHRVALDEAQYIKNPPTKQATAIRSLRTARRVVLTGTPVENRLSELWSIMEFCNPGYLGAATEFRRRFAVPIERHRDAERARRLRLLVRPFVLRRLKTDPDVIDDLPECVQTKEYATLSPEQAALYENVVNTMLGHVDQAEGMQRRGLILSTLIKLKQICNHPAQFLNEFAPGRGGVRRASGPPGGEVDLPALSSRSRKAQRLIQMLEEVLATGERALVFTQFRQMGHLLSAMIQHDLDCATLFLHGGTPQAKRHQLIDRFQSPDGDAPVFILSLRAGGVGLNLTAANHVFHFDRWWNPAVENQATDRAYRIGQSRTVHVHKFVCIGTLEERIDQMIEQKTELAQNIIGAGEEWLTELSMQQLRDLFILRDTALESDS